MNVWYSNYGGKYGRNGGQSQKPSVNCDRSVLTALPGGDNVIITSNNYGLCPFGGNSMDRKRKTGLLKIPEENRDQLPAFAMFFLFIFFIIIFILFYFFILFLI